ncbi:MAG: hypothetical protein J6V07_04945 [Clostridia bacterium]|nr:hypothetical protein [Clostridia bacterium]
MRKQEFLDLVQELNGRLAAYRQELSHDYYGCRRQNSPMDPIGTRERNFFTACDNAVNWASRLYREVSRASEEWVAGSQKYEKDAETIRRTFQQLEVKYFDIKKEFS